MTISISALRNSRGDGPNNEEDGISVDVDSGAISVLRGSKKNEGGGDVETGGGAKPTKVKVGDQDGTGTVMSAFTQDTSLYTSANNYEPPSKIRPCYVALWCILVLGMTIGLMAAFRHGNDDAVSAATPPLETAVEIPSADAEEDPLGLTTKEVDEDVAEAEEEVLLLEESVLEHDTYNNP